MMTREAKDVSDLLTAYFAALVRRDTAWVSTNSVSESSIPFTGIGSLPDETYDLQQLVDHLGGYSPTTLNGSKPAVVVHENVAWAVDQPVCVLPDRTEIPVRATFVAVRLEGAWKVAQFHVSEGVNHDLAIG